MTRSYQLDIHRCTHEDCICPAAEEGWCTTEDKLIPDAYTPDAFPDFCPLREKASETMGYQRLKVVFDGPPAPESGRFIEVEREDGSSVNAGEWEDLKDGMWALWLNVIDEDIR